MQRPNVLIILTDDQGWGDLSIHGNNVLETPNIDSFARSAVRFNRFYVSPVCAPTRASLLTGRYHISTGTTWVTHRKEVMRSEEVTLAELLGVHGYRTALYGKWHNGEQYPNDPIGQGFQEFFGFKTGHLNNYFDTKLIRNFSFEQTKGYVPDILTDEAIQFMQRDDPFFCMLAYNTPHAPFQVPDKYFDKYKNKGLDDKTAAVYGMVENLDDNVARILTSLKDSGKEDNTIVIFMTDNGPNGVRYNGGFKGIKAHVDEGGVRVPFFIRYPDQSIENKIIEHSAAHIDILPTIAELTGIEIPDSLEIHGVSLVPLLTNGDSAVSEDRFLFTHQVIREFDTIPGAVRSNQYLLTLKPNDTAFYDLLADPFQQNDLSPELTAVKNDYTNRYKEWFENVTKNGVTPPLIQIGYEIISEVEFPAQDCHKYGSLKFQGGMGWANDWLVGWKSEADSAVWSFNAVAEQSYDILFELASHSPLEVYVSLDNQEYKLSLRETIEAPVVPNRDRESRTEVEERSWARVKIGTVNIAKGTHCLKVFTRSDSDFELKSVILKKI